MEEGQGEGESDDVDGGTLSNLKKTTKATLSKSNKSNPTQNIISKNVFKLKSHYSMSKPAYALIFSHREFLDPNQTERECTIEDTLKLKSLLCYMKIHYEHCENYTLKQIKETLEKYRKFKFDKYSSLLVIVSTHGEGNGRVFAKDGSYDLHDVLYSNFKNEQCPQLKGKPRIFLIQACQGNNIDYAVAVQCRVQCDNSYFPRGPHANLPKDFLVAYSTIDGYYSFQKRSQGSWFIQETYKELLENCYKKDLISCLTTISRVIATEKEANNAEKGILEGKQNVCIVHNMDKLLQFKK